MAVQAPNPCHDLGSSALSFVIANFRLSQAVILTAFPLEAAINWLLVKEHRDLGPPVLWRLAVGYLERFSLT